MTAPTISRDHLREIIGRMRSGRITPVDLARSGAVDEATAMAAAQLGRSAPLRVISFEQVREEVDDEPGDGLDIEGYGAVFDSITEINGWEGNFQEKIRRGAFRKSLRELGPPKMQFDHGHHPLLGGLPLGRWHIAEEDTRGLHLVGRVYDNWLTLPFRDAMMGPDKSVDGMSFRFGVVKEQWTDKDGKRITDDHELFELLYYGASDRGPITRELIEVKAPEAGPVVWPAYKDTEVGVRADDGGSDTLVIDWSALRSATDPAATARMRRQLAEIVARADAAVSAVLVHTDAVATHSPMGEEGRTDEPHATGTPAGEHSDTADTRTAEPPATETRPAGEHSDPSTRPASTQRPVAPAAIRTDVRGTYREYLQRTLALPDS